MKKIFPEEIPAKGQNKQLRREKDKVDNIVDDIQAQIDKITQETNHWAKQLHNETADNVQLLHGGGVLPLRGSRGGVVRRGNNNHSDEQDDNNNNNNTVQPFYHEDSMEEIKLSHELLHDEKELTQKLAEKSNVLQNQLDDYYRLVQGLQTRLKESEGKFNDLESKFTVLEEDKVALEEELRRRPVANGGGLLLGAANPLNTLNANKLKERDDLQKRSEELRKQLLFDNDDDDVVITFDDLLKGKNLLAAVFDFLSHLTPLKRDIRSIQARFGASVTSYFSFYRYLFLQSFIIAAVEAVCLILHIINLANRGVSWEIIYSFSGQLPYVMALSSFSSDEGLLYDVMVLAPLLILLVTICLKVAEEDKIAKHLTALEGENSRQYSKEVLAVWDNALTSTNDVDEYAGTLANKFLLLLDETATAGVKKKRSRSEEIKISIRRFLGMCYYLLLVGASFSVIIYVTISSAAITDSASQISFLRNFTAFIVTIILNFINGITPTILEKLTEYEAWDSAQTIANIVLFRLYVSNLLNALILAASYLLLADPLLLASQPDLRNSVSVQLSTAFNCRFDQVSSGLFTLVMVTWLLDLISFYATPLGYHLLEKYYPTSSIPSTNNNTAVISEGEEKKDEENNNNDNRRESHSSVRRRSSAATSSSSTANNKEKEKEKEKEKASSGGVKKTEFQVASTMIKRLNFAGLMLIALPFCPLLYLLLPLHFFIGFKFEKFVLRRWYCKPSRQWAGQKAGFVYSSLYLFTYLAIGATSTAYFLSSKTFAKSCDIQDKYIGLCEDGTYDASTETCTIDTSSSYAKTYSSNYPAVICSNACGPFVDDASNLSPFRSLIETNIVTSTIWDLCFYYPYIPCVGCILLGMIIALSRNSVDVLKIVSFNKERNLETQILALEAERKKQVKVIQKLKTIESASVKEE